MPSVASQVNASINQHRDAKASASANGSDRNSSSPFEEMLDSTVASEHPAPPAKETSPAKASKGNAATPGKKAQSADEPPATDDAMPRQASDAGRDEAARGENEPTLADLVGKALTADAADGVLPQPSEVVGEGAPAEQPIVDIGLAAFLEAVASAAAPVPDVPQAKDEPPKAEANVKGDADTQASVVAPVKADAVAAQVVALTAEVAAQPDGAVPTRGAKITPAVGAASALPETVTSPAQHVAASQSPGEGLPVGAAAADSEAGALPRPIEAPKPHGDGHKHRVETTVQHTEAAKLQPAVAGASQGEASTSLEPEAPAPNLAHVAHRHAAAADAKPAKAGVSTMETSASPKPVDASQTLQTWPQMATPTAGAIQSPSVQKDVAPVAAAVPIEGVAVEIAARASEGMKSFEIRLDPPELGRIHVRLDVDRNGEITSRVMADRQDTLDLLRRDASQLERALNDAGLRTSNNGLQFSLRDHGQGQQQQQQQQILPNATRLIIPDDSLAAELTQRGYYRPAGSAGGIDIRV